MEGVPLVGAATIKLQHKDISASTVTMDRGLSSRPVPSCIAVSRDIDVSASVCGNAIAHIKTIWPIESVPPIGAAAAQFQHKDVRGSIAVGVERALYGRTIPSTNAPSCDINVSASVCGYVKALSIDR